MKIHCLQHLKNDTLGNVGTWVSLKGHRLTKTLLYEETVFPDPEEFDMLLIMGGTMSVYQEEEFPWLRPEKEFAKKVINAGKPVLGSCFGAQLIAEVLGGKVTRNRFKEIGWHRVKALAGENTKGENANHEREIISELPSGLFPEFTAFMWHGDTFEIPVGAVRLFGSEACRNQGFSYGENVLGLQFHPEADRQWIENLIEDSGHELVEGKYIQSKEQIFRHENFLEDSRKIAFSLMEWFEKRCEN
jgi:GMP synthase-like glutamine amidotransferase